MYWQKRQRFLVVLSPILLSLYNFSVGVIIHLDGLAEMILPIGLKVFLQFNNVTKICGTIHGDKSISIAWGIVMLLIRWIGIELWGRGGVTIVLKEWALEDTPALSAENLIIIFRSAVYYFNSSFIYLLFLSFLRIKDILAADIMSLPDHTPVLAMSSFLYSSSWTFLLSKGWSLPRFLLYTDH